MSLRRILCRLGLHSWTLFVGHKRCRHCPAIRQEFNP